jgi:hypothetical protein
MKKAKSLYHGHRFPAAVISQAVRLDSDNYFGRSLTMVLAGGEESEAA